MGKDVAHVQAEMIPINLIWSELALWLLSSGICKIPGALNMPMGKPIMPLWSNDHDVVHLQVQPVQMNLIWSEPSGC